MGTHFLINPSIFCCCISLHRWWCFGPNQKENRLKCKYVKKTMILPKALQIYLLTIKSSLKDLPTPRFLSLLFFLLDKRFNSCLSYLFVISFWKMLSNSYTVRPVNDLKSNGFLDSLSYESNERTRKWSIADHIVVYSNYARDLLNSPFDNNFSYEKMDMVI